MCEPFCSVLGRFIGGGTNLDGCGGQDTGNPDRGSCGDRQFRPRRTLVGADPDFTKTTFRNVRDDAGLCPDQVVAAKRLPGFRAFQPAGEGHRCPTGQASCDQTDQEASHTLSVNS